MTCGKQNTKNSKTLVRQRGRRAQEFGTLGVVASIPLPSFTLSTLNIRTKMVGKDRFWPFFCSPTFKETQVV